LRAKNAGKDFLLYAGGRHALGILEGAPALYWPELWGARALLYVWGDGAAPYIVVGLTNVAWRVREMCARVVLLRDLQVGPKLVRMTTDEVPRVRAAALHALAAQGTAANLSAIVQRLRDPDKEVRRAAQQARDLLQERWNLSSDELQGIEQSHGTKHTRSDRQAETDTGTDTDTDTDTDTATGPGREA
jgi:hypothetical protein